MCGFFVDLQDEVLQIIFSEHDSAGSESVRLNRVAAGFKKALMNVANHVRPGDDQVLVAPVLAAEVLRREVLQLDRGAHRAVEDKNLPSELL